MIAVPALCIVTVFLNVDTYSYLVNNISLKQVILQS